MWTGLVGATATVFVTTLDDSVWLIPYVGSSSLGRWTESARLMHAATFVFTLECMAVMACLIALAIEAGALRFWKNDQSQEDRIEIVTGSIGAILCWCMALFLYIKKLRKRQQRQQQNSTDEERVRLSNSNTNDRSQNQQQSSSSYGSSRSENRNDGTVDNRYQQRFDNTEEDDYEEQENSLGTVMSLTLLGSLDEVSYFPAVIVGNIFTPLELCLGTLLASLLILLMVTTCLAQYKPLAECLDRIPLYGIIGMFGTILTVGVLWDVFSSDV